MSQDNVEIVRRGIEAWNRRDVDGFVALVGPDTEVVPVIEAGPLRGPDAIRGWLRENFETMAEFRTEVGEVRDLDDKVVVLGSVHTRGHASGVELDSPIGFVASFQAGRVIRLEVFVDPAKALEAAGLSE
jgi:ketosteroid isomerase-like protein